MGLATLTCTLGYPAIIRVAFDPRGPGSHYLSLNAFLGGGILVTCYFLFVALVTWTYRWARPSRSQVGRTSQYGPAPPLGERKIPEAGCGHH